MNKRLKKLIDGTFIKVAQDLVKNPEGLKYKLSSAREKLNSENVKDALGKYWADVLSFIKMIKYWVSRKYTDVSTQTIIYATVAVIYFLTPADLVPDIILGLGFIDDIAVISYVLNLIRDDLEKFRAWYSEYKASEEVVSQP